MFTYVGLFRVAPIAREHLEKTPEYFDKIYKIVEDEGGTVEHFFAIMGPWEYLGIFEYPDLETAFRVDKWDVQTYNLLELLDNLEPFDTITEGDMVIRIVKAYGFDQIARLSSGSPKGGITFLVKNR